MNIPNFLRKSEGQIEIIVPIFMALIIASILTLGIRDISKKQQEKRELEQYVSALSEEHKEPQKVSEFYGEQILGGYPPEIAFTLVGNEGEWYIERRKRDGVDVTDPSIHSYASFDPKLSNVLVIWLYNQSSSPIEIDYEKDKYFLQTIEAAIHPLQIDMNDSEYNGLVGSQEYKVIWVKYPSVVLREDIKAIVIKLETAKLVIGLQRIPR